MDFRKTLEECKAIVNNLFDILIRVLIDKKSSTKDNATLAKHKEDIKDISRTMKRTGCKNSAIECAIKTANGLIEEIENNLF